jgi:hypothetical protein
MKSEIRLAGILVCWGVTMSLIAQEPTLPPVPDGPLLKRTPDYSAWSVITKGSPAIAEAPPKDGGDDGTNAKANSLPITQSKVVKTGKVIVEQNTDARGQLHQIWHVGGLRAMKLPDTDRPLVCPDYGGGDIYSVNFAASDFSGLDWISESTYAGMKKYEGRDCIVFQGKVSPLSIEAQKEERNAIAYAKGYGEQLPQSSEVPAVAYIDLETRLPLLVTFGNEKRFYQYAPPPQAQLSLPSEITTSLRDYLQRIKRLSAPPSKPY